MKAFLMGAAMALSGCTTLISSDYHHYEGEVKTVEQLALVEAVPTGQVSFELIDRLNAFLTVSDVQLQQAHIQTINGQPRISAFGTPLKEFNNEKKMRVLLPAGPTLFDIAFDKRQTQALIELAANQRYFIFEAKFDKEVTPVSGNRELHTWKEAVVFYNASTNEMFFVSKNGELLSV